MIVKKSSPCRNHPQGGGVCSSHAAVRPRQSPCSAPGLSSPAKWPLGTGAVLVKTAFKMSGHLKIEDKSQECSSLAFGGSAQRGGPSRTRQRAKVWAATSSAVSPPLGYLHRQGQRPMARHEANRCPKETPTQTRAQTGAVTGEPDRRQVENFRSPTMAALIVPKWGGVTATIRGPRTRPS